MFYVSFHNPSHKTHLLVILPFFTSSQILGSSTLNLLNTLYAIANYLTCVCVPVCACYLILWTFVVIEKMHCFVPLKNATLCCAAVQVILVLILTLYGFFGRSGVKQLDFYGSNKTPKPNLLGISYESQQQYQLLQCYLPYIQIVIPIF